MKNYYEILEVNKKASKEVIEKAYKVLVKKYHPDLQNNTKQTDIDQKIKEINEAYEVLSNDFLREQYNLELEKQEAQNNQAVEELNETMKKHKVGTFSGIFALLKSFYKQKTDKQEKKQITRKDIVAIMLTIVVVIVIGIILWFIPFTNGWMRELLFENPLFNWIGGLFVARQH